MSLEGFTTFHMEGDLTGFIEKSKDYLKTFFGSYYTYVLSEGTVEKPFYVGKGRGFRSLNLFYNKGGRTDKQLHFNKLLKKGTVILLSVRKAESEEEALIYETNLIAMYGRKGIESNGLLLNKQDKGYPSFKELKYSTKGFRKALLNVWNRDEIDLSKTFYRGANTPVTIRCLVHDLDCQIRAGRALEGVEFCPECNNYNISQTLKGRPNDVLRMAQSDAISKLLSIEGFNYSIDTSTFNYYSFDSEVTVSCSEPGHGPFQTYYCTLRRGRKACPKCQGRKLDFSEAEELRKNYKRMKNYHFHDVYSHHLIKKIVNFEGAYSIDSDYSKYKK